MTKRDLKCRKGYKYFSSSYESNTYIFEDKVLPYLEILSIKIVSRKYNVDIKLTLKISIRYTYKLYVHSKKFYALFYSYNIFVYSYLF